MPPNEAAAILYLSRPVVQNSAHFLCNVADSCKMLAVKTLSENVLNRKRYDTRYLALANSSASTNVLKGLLSFMQRRHGCHGPIDHQQLDVFLDRINAVKPEVYGAQLPLELIRQSFDYDGWYDSTKLEFQRVADTTIVADIRPVGGGLFSVPELVLCHFIFILVPRYLSDWIIGNLSQLFRHHIAEHCEAVRGIHAQASRAYTFIYLLFLHLFLNNALIHHYQFLVSFVPFFRHGLFLKRLEPLQWTETHL
jgi:hypothetical protein